MFETQINSAYNTRESVLDSEGYADWAYDKEKDEVNYDVELIEI